jgi:hypothetical protein
MTIYLGPAGNLQALPYMGRGVGAALDLGAAVQRTLGGPRTVDYIGTPKRSYQLSREFLTADELSILEGLALGAYGPGPLILIDPWRRNLLTANQAAAGDASHDLTGWTGSATAVLSLIGPDSTLALRGQYAVRATMGTTGSNQGPRLGDGSTAAQVIATACPVMPGLTHTASGWLRLASGTASSWRPVLAWYTTAGTASVINPASTGTASTPTGTWSQRVVTGTAPSDAAYVLPRFDTSPTVVHAVDFDDVILTQGTSTIWTMGTGVPRVAFTDLGDTYPIFDNHNVSISLQEVG